MELIIENVKANYVTKLSWGNIVFFSPTWDVSIQAKQNLLMIFQKGYIQKLEETVMFMKWIGCSRWLKREWHLWIQNSILENINGA